ncbi:MAG TPA: phosphoribosylglycinamide formyltransferase [Saprospiraceae bacterium]|nr:phosphoribosylglycinamide formyltransferase [Saprospiraceae bacterium]HMQ83489.1 phosphoribosylglycinamide formyltransferase [Saprospiraceae bacterium]
MVNIAVFASGTGSNARKIVEYFKGNPNIQVTIIVCNNAKAPVLQFAAETGIEQLVINKTYFYDSRAILEDFKQRGIGFIVLAGFLWLVPDYLVKAYERRMLNIHPALLPRYGGKGMFGMHVHQAVKAASEKESGISIHYVNEFYDDGDILFQKACILEPDDEPEDIARKVQQLEHQYYAPIIEQAILENQSLLPN